MLLKRPDLAKVLTLNVDPKSYWIYTNTPLDNERVAADRFANTASRRAWTASRPRPEHGRCRYVHRKVIPIGLILVAAGSHRAGHIQRSDTGHPRGHGVATKL